MDSDKAQANAPSGDGNTITRCIINNCTITNSCVNRSTLSDCVLLKTEDVSRSTAQKSQFHDAASVERSDITNSTIQSQSSAHRSTIGQSVIQDESAVKRSVVTGTTVSRSQIERATVTNCVVAECVIERSDFQGLVLKYGIWKRNELVGKTGDHDPIVIRNYESGAGQSASVLGSSIPRLDPKSHDRETVPPGYHNDQHTSGDSPDDYGLDLPPPYRP